MRRKSDMWQNVDGFLPDEDKQAAQIAAADVQERLTVVEDQLRSQFTSMAAYHQIAQQSIDSARAEARADLDRERSTIVSLIERVRDEYAPVDQISGDHMSGDGMSVDTLMDITAVDRLSLLEHRFEQLATQFAQCLKLQEDLANSIAFMFEQQVRNAGYLEVVPAS